MVLTVRTEYTIKTLCFIRISLNVVILRNILYIYRVSNPNVLGLINIVPGGSKN